MNLIKRFFTVRHVLAVLMIALAATGFAQENGNHIIGQEQFTDLATQILTYLGYAVVAGLSVLVAVIGARRAWSFMRRFL